MRKCRKKLRLSREAVPMSRASPQVAMRRRPRRTSLRRGYGGKGRQLLGIGEVEVLPARLLSAIF